jgi:hypothetical protein
MGFVANDKVPIRVGELGLNVLISAELIQAANGSGRLCKPVAGAGGFKRVVCEDFEVELEAL